MVGVHALTQVIKEDTAMQHSSIQMPSDLTLLMAKVLALFKEGVCMGGGGDDPQTIQSLGETATTFCSFFPSKLRTQ